MIVHACITSCFFMALNPNMKLHKYHGAKESSINYSNMYSYGCKLWLVLPLINDIVYVGTNNHACNFPTHLLLQN